MGYISTRMMECEDTFSDMGSLKQHLELPREYAYDDGEICGLAYAYALLICSYVVVSLSDCLVSCCSCPAWC